MKNFVISLTTAHKRREHICKEFETHSVKFDFFDALTPPDARSFAASLDLDMVTANLSPGELACMMSHVAIWKKTIDNVIPYVTIFEDDVYLGNDAQKLLNSSKWIKPQCNIIKIESVLSKTIVANNSITISDTLRELKQLKHKHLGTGGYILSLEGARIFYEYINKTYLRPLDELIFEEFIATYDEPVYQMVPALCIQEIILAGPGADLSLPSLLINERQDRMSSNKIATNSKIRRELRRLNKQIKTLLFAKEIAFE